MNPHLNHQKGNSMRICVFCGASAGNHPDYLQAATQLGHALAGAGIGLVYGGASVGLMGRVADAVLERGGEVTGVLPQFLADRELAHHGLTTLHTVASMHERKAMMADLADGFIALPGGIGTLEELFEIWTWAMLGQHRKPVALLNARDYYGKLLAFMNHVTTEGFLQQANRDMLLVDDDPARLLDAMRRYQPPVTGRWMPKEGT